MNEWTAYLNGGRGTGDSPPADAAQERSGDLVDH